MGRIRRTPWRHALSPAPHPANRAFRLVAPGGVAAERVEVASGPLRRARGLLGRSSLDPGTALLLAPCSGVHTIGMRFPIDAVFCDRSLTVLAVRTLAPGKLSRKVRGARCCLELPAGAAGAAGIREGVTLRFESPA